MSRNYSRFNDDNQSVKDAEKNMNATYYYSFRQINYEKIDEL